MALFCLKYLRGRSKHHIQRAWAQLFTQSFGHETCPARTGSYSLTWEWSTDSGSDCTFLVLLLKDGFTASDIKTRHAHICRIGIFKNSDCWINCVFTLVLLLRIGPNQTSKGTSSGNTGFIPRSLKSLCHVQGKKKVNTIRESVTTLPTASHYLLIFFFFLINI